MSVVHSTTGFDWNTLLPTCNTVQKGLLVLSVAANALSVIPPLRFAGSLGARSIALLSSTLHAATTDSKEHLVNRLAVYTKVATVAVGLVAVAIASPLLVLASLAADAAIQAFDAVKAGLKGEIRNVLRHISFIAINSLAIAAIATGAWQLMATAAAVNCIVLFGLSVTSLSLANEL